MIVLKNVHKTYLLGVEGVTALRGSEYKTLSIYRCQLEYQRG